MKTVKYNITGRVQGVGFRWFAIEKARALDICGTVKNCFDGSVEVIAQADGERLETFEKELQQGPSTARVDNMQAQTLSSEKHYENFKVVY